MSATTVKIFDVDKPKISISYWVALGAIPFVGVGVWMYYRSNKAKKDSATQKNGFSDKGILNIKDKINASELSTKKEEIVPKVETPLERAQSIKDKGNVFFKEGKYNDAIRCYSEAIDLCPKSETNILSTFFQNRAACHDQLNNMTDLVKDCTAALELNPKYTKALSRRAKAFQNQGQLSECLEDITALCILEGFSNPRSLETADTVLKDLGKMHAKEAMLNKEPVKPSHYFVKTYFSSFPNDPVISFSDFEAVEINSSQNGDEAMSHLERAKKLLLRAQYDEVIPECTAAIEQGEGLEPEALLLRATLYLIRGQHPQALEDLTTIIESEVQNKKITVNALIKRASLFLQSEQKDKCFKDFETATALDPDNPDIYLHRGQVNLLMENVKESSSDFKKCVSLDPDFAIAVMQGLYADYRNCVQQESMTGIAKVIEKFKRAIKKFPKCTESYVLLAQILMDQQQFDESDQYFSTAIEKDPTNANLFVHRGLLQLHWKSDIDTAMRLINEGIKVDERCSFCYETLGTIEVQRGNLRRAVELFDKAIPLSKTELELSHIYSLRDAAKAQQIVADKLKIPGLIDT